MPLLRYTDTVIAPMRELMLQEKVANIPDIELKGNTDISLLVSNIATASFTLDATSSPKKKMNATFDTITEYFDDDTNVIRTQSVEHITKALGAILENSYGTIVEDIGSMVDDLREKIERRFSEHLASNGADDLLENDVEVTEADYAILRWEKLRSPSRQDEIITTACSNINISTEKLTLVNLGHIQSKLKFNAAMVEVHLDPEVRQAILDKLLATFTTDKYGISEDRIDRFLKVSFSKVAYSTFCATILAKMKKIDDVPATVMFLLQLANDFQTIMGRANMIISDKASASDLQHWVLNAKQLDKTMMAVLYYCLYHKQVKFKGKLLLSRTILNNDTYQKFLKEGHVIREIRDYLKAYYREVEVPLGGVSLNAVLTTNVSERLAKQSALNRTNARFIKTKYLMQAYRVTMNEFISKVIEEDLFSYSEDRSIVARFASIAKSRSIAFNGDIGKVDDALYDVLITTFYPDDLVATVFSYTRRAMTNLALESDIDDEKILDAEVDSSVHILTDYIYDKLTNHRNSYKGTSPHQ